MNPHPNAPAFPVATDEGPYFGMSIRIWLAGQAIAGLTAVFAPWAGPPTGQSDPLAGRLAEWAVLIADQVIDKLKTPPASAAGGKEQPR